ncbi:Glycosyltransferase, GT2 family [Methylobacterium sp. 190mf]|uniref:glycosyltransferase family 2 protein n=1 Tax=Methylobacterium sp. 190mf TaxID=1761798 RepID=UPI00089F7EBE|nr:glycosyltransferase [Methylobacterium sp. 190mf]SEF81724.1 Glycosyltransferase, GT2 family [Methylobacterium sp. 190mf]
MLKKKPVPAPSASWGTLPWPDAILPLPLDGQLRPLDERRLAQVASGQFPACRAIFVAPAASELRPDLAAHLTRALAERPDIGIFYGDDAVVDGAGQVRSVHCKPAFNPALLMADDFIGFPLLIRVSALAGLSPDFGLRHGSAAWFRFLLGAISAGIGIDRIPQTLIASPLERPKAMRTARAHALDRWFEASGMPLRTAPGLTPDTLEIRRSFDARPAVTLVVPTNQSRPKDDQGRAVEGAKPHVINLLDSLGRSTYPADRIRVLIGDDVADDAIYRGRSDRFTVTRLLTTRAPGERFNYAAKMNTLWRAAETDLVILMNDDLVVRRPGWIEALLTFALDRGVGGAGGRLLFPTGKIQHAGMTGGIFDVFAHPWYNRDAAEPTYGDWALTQRDCSAVTGALFATRKAVLEAVNGFDEGFALDFNDVDLCLKMRQLGYRIVYTPFAEMAHHESASRQTSFAPGSQIARFLRRWGDVIAEDPAYSPQLRIDTDVVAPRADATRWIAERRADAA